MMGIRDAVAAELLDAIRSNDAEAVRHEAIQVAAVAMRLAGQCAVPLCSVFEERSGFRG